MRSAAVACILFAEAASAAPSLAEAKAYVLGIYRSVPRDNFDYRSVRYAPRMASLIRRDDACGKKGGGICVLDAVMFCECQDTDENYAVLRADVVRQGVDRAKVKIALRNGKIERFAIDLEMTGSAWSVADIHGPEMPSWRAYLEQRLPEEEAALRAEQKRRVR